MSPHSEEWVFRSPELVVGRASIAPLTYRVTHEHAAPFWVSEFPLILRNEFPALQSSLLVEPALLPSPRGSPLSMLLPSEHRSSLSFWGMSSPLSRARCWQSQHCSPHLEGHLWACPLPSERLSSLSFWGMSSPLPGAAVVESIDPLWVTHELPPPLSVWVPLILHEFPLQSSLWESSALSLT